ncbi:GL26919 [Drosophila persimilis]|uniref:GL26919 n=1 Tax=Drosophila persimilis TaxID=7234 RepID=B4H2W3_DROPE|nr:GL26919 [Drosophila persimilis]
MTFTSLALLLLVLIMGLLFACHCLGHRAASWMRMRSSKEEKIGLSNHKHKLFHANGYMASIQSGSEFLLSTSGSFKRFDTIDKDDHNRSQHLLLLNGGGAAAGGGGSTGGRLDADAQLQRELQLLAAEETGAALALVPSVPQRARPHADWGGGDGDRGAATAHHHLDTTVGLAKVQRPLGRADVLAELPADGGAADHCGSEGAQPEAGCGTAQRGHRAECVREEYKQRFPTFSSPLMERMRKRRAFADPELNYAMEATLGGNALYAAAAAAAAAAMHQSGPPPFTASNTIAAAVTTTPMPPAHASAKKPKLSFSIESIMGIST